MVLRDIKNQCSAGTATTGSGAPAWNVPLLKRVQMALASKSTGSENQDTPVAAVEQSSIVESTKPMDPPESTKLIDPPESSKPMDPPESSKPMDPPSQMAAMEPPSLICEAVEGDLSKSMNEAFLGDLSKYDSVICDTPNTSMGENNNQTKPEVAVSSEQTETSPSACETALSTSFTLSEKASSAVEPMECVTELPSEDLSTPIPPVPEVVMTPSQALCQENPCEAPGDDVDVPSEVTDFHQGPVIITKRRVARTKKVRRQSAGIQPLDVISEGPPSSLTPPESSSDVVAVPTDIVLSVPVEEPCALPTLPTPPEEEAPTDCTMAASVADTMEATSVEPEAMVAHVEIGRRRRGARTKSSLTEDNDTNETESFTTLKPRSRPAASEPTASAAQITNRPRPAPRRRAKKETAVLTPSPVSMETISEDSNSSSDSRTEPEIGPPASSESMSENSGIASTAPQIKPRRRGRPHKASRSKPASTPTVLPSQPGKLPPQEDLTSTETDGDIIPKPASTGQGKAPSDGVSVTSSEDTVVEGSNTTATDPECISQPVEPQVPQDIITTESETIKPKKRGRKPRRCSGGLVSAPLPASLPIDIIQEESNRKPASTPTVMPSQPDKPPPQEDLTSTQTHGDIIPKPASSGQAKASSDGVSVPSSENTLLKDSNTTPTDPECISQPVEPQVPQNMVTTESETIKPKKRARKPRRCSGGLVSAPLPASLPIDILQEESNRKPACTPVVLPPQPGKPPPQEDLTSTETDGDIIPRPASTGQAKAPSDGVSVTSSGDTLVEEGNTTPIDPQCISQPVEEPQVPLDTVTTEPETIKPKKRGRKPRRRSGGLVSAPLPAPLPVDVLQEESNSSQSSTCSGSSEPVSTTEPDLTDAEPIPTADDAASTLDLELALRDARVAEFFNQDLDPPSVSVHTQQTKAKKSRRRSSGADVCLSNILKSPEGVGDNVPELPIRRSKRLRRQSIELYRASIREKEEEALMVDSPQPVAPATVENNVELVECVSASTGPRLQRQANVTEPEPPLHDANLTEDSRRSQPLATVVECVDSDANDSLIATPDLKDTSKSTPRTGRGRKRKRETNIEDIYLNRLWRTQMPKEKTWETIYEQPRVSRTGDESYQSNKRFKRAVNFDDFYQYSRLKRRRQKASKQGWKPMSEKREALVEKLVDEHLAKLEEDLTRSQSTVDGRYDRAMCAFLQLGSSGETIDNAAPCTDDVGDSMALCTTGNDTPASCPGDVAVSEGLEPVSPAAASPVTSSDATPNVPPKHPHSQNTDSSVYPFLTPGGSQSDMEDPECDDVFYTPARTVSDLAKFSHLDTQEPGSGDSNPATPNSSSNHSGLSRTLTLTPEADGGMSPSY